MLRERAARPFNRQCHEKGRTWQPQARALHSVAPGQITAHLAELRRVSPNTDVKLMRGTADETLDMLKRGQAELAFASTTADDWERFERWSLFEEGFHLLAHRDNPLASGKPIGIADVRR